MAGADGYKSLEWVSPRLDSGNRKRLRKTDLNIAKPIISLAAKFGFAHATIAFESSVSQ